MRPGIGARLSFSNVTAAVALFVALGGGSLAIASHVGQERKVVRRIADSQITKRAPGLSVSHAGSADRAGSADLASAAQRAVRADRSTIADRAADADHATSADHATDADHANFAELAANANRVGGVPASSFVSGDDIGRVDTIITTDTPGTKGVPMLTMGPLSLLATCNLLDDQDQALIVSAKSSALGGSIGYGISGGPAAPNAEGGAFDVGGASYQTVFFRRLEPGSRHAGGGEIVYRDPSTTISLTFRYFVSQPDHQCQVFGVAARA